MTPEKDDSGFNARLRTAMQKKTPESASQEESNADAWRLGGRVGVDLVSALSVGLGLGWSLDRWLHTRPVFLVVGLLLGGTAGVLNVWRVVGW